MTKSLLPKSALAHHLAVLGKTGSGKTSIIKAAMIEPSIAADERVCIIDPTGAWWGLRLLADGKTKGFPVYVFGGRHADYPLLGSHGEAMADVIGTTNTPAILDTSMMKTGERIRFFTDFADAILRKNEGPLRLVIDEAHVFMPQSGTRGGGPVPDMLHAGNNLISLGRSRGLRIVLISQRAAKLHKDSLTQVETLIACRLIAPQDRQAVRDWIADQADLEKGKEIIASLTKLRDGEGWVWAPEADFLKQIQFPRPETYDSSAAPTKTSATKKLSPIDLDVLKNRLAKVDAQVRENDPKALRADNAKLKAEKATLEKQLAAAVAAKVVADPQTMQKAEQRGYERGKKEVVAAAQKNVKEAHLAILESVVGKFAPITELLDREMKAARAAKVDLAKAVTYAPATPAPMAVAPLAPIPRPAPREAPPAASYATPTALHSAGEASLTPSKQRILDALAWWESLGNFSPARTIAAFVADMSPKSSTWEKYVSNLRSDGLIQYPGEGLLGLTDQGRALAAMPATAADHAALMAKIAPAPMRLLQAAVKAYPAALSRESLGAFCEPPMSPASSSFEKYVSQLKSFGLFTYPDKGTVRAAEFLFPERRTVA